MTADRPTADPRRRRVAPGPPNPKTDPADAANAAAGRRAHSSSIQRGKRHTLPVGRAADVSPTGNGNGPAMAQSQDKTTQAKNRQRRTVAAPLRHSHTAAAGKVHQEPRPEHKSRREKRPDRGHPVQSHNVDADQPAHKPRAQGEYLRDGERKLRDDRERKQRPKDALRKKKKKKEQGSTNKDGSLDKKMRQRNKKIDAALSAAEHQQDQPEGNLDKYLQKDAHNICRRKPQNNRATAKKKEDSHSKSDGEGKGELSREDQPRKPLEPEEEGNVPGGARHNQGAARRTRNGQRQVNNNIFRSMPPRNLNQERRRGKNNGQRNKSLPSMPPFVKIGEDSGSSSSSSDSDSDSSSSSSSDSDSDSDSDSSSSDSGHDEPFRAKNRTRKYQQIPSGPGSKSSGGRPPSRGSGTVSTQESTHESAPSGKGGTKELSPRTTLKKTGKVPSYDALLAMMRRSGNSSPVRSDDEGGAVRGASRKGRKGRRSWTDEDEDGDDEEGKTEKELLAEMARLLTAKGTFSDNSSHHDEVGGKAERRDALLAMMRKNRRTGEGSSPVMSDDERGAVKGARRGRRVWNDDDDDEDDDEGSETKKELLAEMARLLTAKGTFSDNSSHCKDPGTKAARRRTSYSAQSTQDGSGPESTKDGNESEDTFDSLYSDNAGPDDHPASTELPPDRDMMERQIRNLQHSQPQLVNEVNERKHQKKIGDKIDPRKNNQSELELIARQLESIKARREIIHRRVEDEVSVSTMDKKMCDLDHDPNSGHSIPLETSFDHGCLDTLGKTGHMGGSGVLDTSGKIGHMSGSSFFPDMETSLHLSDIEVTNHSG